MRRITFREVVAASTSPRRFLCWICEQPERRAVEIVIPPARVVYLCQLCAASIGVALHRHTSVAHDVYERPAERDPRLPVPS